MLVTFGRAATRELRDRARGRFRDCAAALADPAAARELRRRGDRALGHRVRRRSGGNGVHGCCGRCRISTRPPSSRRTRSVSGCSTVSAWPAITSPMRLFRTTSPTCSAQVSDDLYVADYSSEPHRRELARCAGLATAAADDPQAALVPRCRAGSPAAQTGCVRGGGPRGTDPAQTDAWSAGLQ